MNGVGFMNGLANMLFFLDDPKTGQAPPGNRGIPIPLYSSPGDADPLSAEL
jgi:hypothetical protein